MTRFLSVFVTDRPNTTEEQENHPAVAGPSNNPAPAPPATVENQAAPPATVDNHAAPPANIDNPAAPSTIVDNPTESPAVIPGTPTFTGSASCYFSPEDVRPFPKIPLSNPRSKLKH